MKTHRRFGVDSQLTRHDVYALCEPANGEIRYIGYSKRTQERYKMHLQDVSACLGKPRSEKDRAAMRAGCARRKALKQAELTTGVL